MKKWAALLALALCGNALANDSDPLMDEVGAMLTPAGFALTCGPLREVSALEKRAATDQAAKREVVALGAYCMNTIMAAVEAAQSYGPAKLVGGDQSICLPAADKFDYAAVLTRAIGIEAARRTELKADAYSANDLALIALLDMYPCK